MTIPSHVIQKAYARGGDMMYWDSQDFERDPFFVEDLFSILMKNDLLPKADSKDLSGFVFLGIASNQGSKELSLAKIYDNYLQQAGVSLNKKPLFIVSDFFGEDPGKNGIFVPGFNKENTLGMKNVDFRYLSAKAEDLPFVPNSVDIIFDRRGAFWHAVFSECWESLQRNEDPEAEEISRATDRVRDLLTKTSSLLKDNGVLVLDAPSSSTDLPTSSLLGLLNIDTLLEELDLESYTLTESNHVQTSVMIIRKKG